MSTRVGAGGESPPRPRPRGPRLCRHRGGRRARGPQPHHRCERSPALVGRRRASWAVRVAGAIGGPVPFRLRSGYRPDRAPARQMAAISDGVRRERPPVVARSSRRATAIPGAAATTAPLRAGDPSKSVTSAPASVAIRPAGGQVPRREAPFVVRVEASARHRAEVDGGGALAPDVAHPGEHVDEHPRLLAAPLRVVGEAGPDERVGEVGGRGGSDRLAIPGGTPSPDGAEELVADDVVHDADHRPARRSPPRWTR